MGYFSTLAIDSRENDYDVSWTTHEQQLLWRREDLQSLLDEMRAWGAPYSGSVTYTDDELRYILPEYPGGHRGPLGGQLHPAPAAEGLAGPEGRQRRALRHPGHGGRPEIRAHRHLHPLPGLSAGDGGVRLGPAERTKGSG